MVTVEAFRMDLKEYRVVFITVTFVVALLVASPALQRLLVYPRTDFFTELWLLGPNHKSENYPFNITSNQNYTVFLGVGNHLGYCGYYQVEVKLRNESQPAPTSLGPIVNRTPSSLPSLFNVTAFVADETVWENLLTFSFDYIYDNESEVVRFNSLKFDDVTLDLSDKEAAWNSTRNGFYEDMFFELWLYDATANDFQYDGRFVKLRLNMTVVQ